MFHVYVLRCKDGTLYAGYTNNLERRLKKHQEGKASKYTRSRLPVEMVAHWDFPTKSEAMKHETKFKALPREAKMEALNLGF